MKKLALLAITVLMTSCATVKFYSDAGMSTESGIEFYPPKPYLLVERNTGKDVNMKATIIYLPDQSKPKYAKIQSGFGSADLKMSLENGMLTSYGIITDSKIPETITALSGVVTAVGGYSKSVAEGKAALAGVTEQAANVEDMQNASAILKSIIDGLANDLKVKGTDQFLTDNQKKIAQDIIANLTKQNKEVENFKPLDAPKIAAELNKSAALFNEIASGSETDIAKNYNSKITQYKKEFDKAINLLAPPAKTGQPVFELYEIIIDGKGTKLNKVNHNDL